jgi:hypothetical protein
MTGLDEVTAGYTLELLQRSKSVIRSGLLTESRLSDSDTLGLFDR